MAENDETPDYGQDRGSHGLTTRTWIILITSALLAIMFLPAMLLFVLGGSSGF